MATTPSEHVQLVRDHPTLDTDELQLVNDNLQDVLLVLSELALLGKQAHWNLVGPRFRELHLQLDEFVAAWREQSDDVAERIVALGGVPDGTAATIAAHSGLSGLPVSTIQDSEVVTLITGLITEADGKIRHAMNEIEAPEPVTADMLHSVVKMLEQQLWMIRVQSIRA